MISSSDNLDDIRGVGDIAPFIATLKFFGRIDLAYAVLEEFAKRAHSFEQHDNVAKCYFSLKAYENAIKAGELALAVADSSEKAYIARSNLINVYNHANYPEKALQYIEHNEKFVPSDVSTLLEKSFALFLLNDKSSAEKILVDTLNNTPNLSKEMHTKIKFNLGTYSLHRDEFQKGLRLFIEEGANLKLWNTETIFSRSNTIHFDGKGNMRPDHLFKKWDGKPYPGRPVVLHAEAGIGDEIINVRFIKHIREMGMVPYWFNTYEERKDLLDVFRRNGVNVITSLSEIQESGDVYYAQSMHVPIVMGLEYEDLWYGPYLKADPDYIKTHSININKGNGRRKIGVRWQGNPLYDHDLHRSYKLKDLYEAVKHIDADFYSLQKDTGFDELKDFPGIVDMSGELNTWEDTLGAIENMDFIITSCTSVLHAAAAIGKKTYALIPISAYYVWAHSAKQSPWYGDHVTILRQQKPRVWDEPLAELHNILR